MARGSLIDKAREQGIADRVAGKTFNYERYRGRPNVWSAYSEGYRSQAARDQIECLGLSEFGDTWRAVRRAGLEYADTAVGYPKDHMVPRCPFEEATLLLQLLHALRAGRDYRPPQPTPPEPAEGFKCRTCQMDLLDGGCAVNVEYGYARTRIGEDGKRLPSPMPDRLVHIPNLDMVQATCSRCGAVQSDETTERLRDYLLTRQEKSVTLSAT